MNTQPSRTSEVIDRFNQAFLTMKAAALILAIVLSTSVTAQAQQPTTGNQPSRIEVDAMNTQSSRTSEVIDRFNQAFMRHDGSLLEDLIAEDCVMESVEPAPDGTRVVGRAANLRFWQNLANNRDGAFAVEDVVVFGDRANIRWRYRFGPGLSQSVRGVTLMRLRDGLIVEALAYAKTGDASVGTAVRDASGSESP
jgi:ketosteroid isomerase-like protein